MQCAMQTTNVPECQETILLEWRSFGEIVCIYLKPGESPEDSGYALRITSSHLYDLYEILSGFSFLVRKQTWHWQPL